MSQCHNWSYWLLWKDIQLLPLIQSLSHTCLWKQLSCHYIIFITSVLVFLSLTRSLKPPKTSFLANTLWIPSSSLPPSTLTWASTVNAYPAESLHLKKKLFLKSYQSMHSFDFRHTNHQFPSLTNSFKLYYQHS